MIRSAYWRDLRSWLTATPLDPLRVPSHVRTVPDAKNYDAKLAHMRAWAKTAGVPLLIEEQPDVPVAPKPIPVTEGDLPIG
jgi:hypothetical protein